MRLWILLACCVTSAAARGEHRIGDLFELEPAGMGQLSAHGVAINLDALMQADELPSKVAVAEFLNQAEHVGLAGAPSWFDESKHAVLVRATAEIPEGGVVAEETLPCQVEAVGSDGKLSLLLTATKLHDRRYSDSQAVAVTSGLVGSDGSVPCGVRILRDYLQQWSADGEQPCLVLKLKEHRTTFDDAEILAECREKLREVYRGYRRDERVDDDVQIVGTRHLRVQVPQEYQSGQFASEVGSVMLRSGNLPSIAASSLEVDYTSTRR